MRRNIVMSRNSSTPPCHLCPRCAILLIILCVFQYYFHTCFVTAEPYISLPRDQHLRTATPSSLYEKVTRNEELQSKYYADDIKTVSDAINAISSIVLSSDMHGRNKPKRKRQLPYADRRLIYLPPPPVTPFRGGLKTVRQDPNKNDTAEEVVDASKTDVSQASTASSVIPSAWTPEQYPDPWTDPLACGGAATASFRKNSGKDQTSQQSNSTNMFRTITDRDFMHWFDIPALGHDGKLSEPEEEHFLPKKKLLFCDPDQVLDAITLRNVVLKLQTFAETFASSSLIEGGNFGSDVEEVPFDSSEDTNALPPEGKVSRKGFFFTFLNSLKAMLQQTGNRAANADLVRTQLRGVKPLPLQDLSRGLGVWEEGAIKEPIEVGIALVKKIDLPAILRADSYFFYSDQDDMINDAAQYFARYIHDTWFRRLTMQERRLSSPTNIVLIFISTQDKICYISSGTRIAAILPWWRLEHVVQDMKPELRKGQTGDALSIAIDELTELLQEGPPSILDRLDDFVERFGVVIAFTIFTFVFATWGECRDRRKRFFSAERRSRLTAAEKERARQLQREFKTKMCPICLEPFELTNKKSDNKKPLNRKQTQNLKRIDSFGIPLLGTDGKPIKLLRCGHIFDETCWKMWIDSGHGNPWICPVCRQDVGRVKRQRTNPSSPDRVIATETRRAEEGTRRDEITEERRTSVTRVPPVTPSMLLLPVGHTHPSYSSVQSLASYGAYEYGSTPFAPFSHPPLRRFYPRFATQSNSQTNGAPREDTPLFEQTFTSDENDDY
eukprot:CCRYP_003495-RA/>CCRYP_003495-RA protein AED:0.16 eAED:0.16 QI:805/1/1/1/1/1/4/1170/781